MTDQELDELFRKSFSSHQAPVPEEMWKRVNPQKEKKRRVAFWWSGLGVAAILLAGFFVRWNGNSSATKTVATKVTSLPQTSKEQSLRKIDSLSQPSLSKNTNGGQNSSPLESSATDLASPATHNSKQNNAILFSHKEKAQRQHESVSKNELTIANNKQHLEETVNKEERATGKTSDQGNKGSQETSDLISLIPNDSAASAGSAKLAKVDSAASKASAATVPVRSHKQQHKINLEWMASGYTGDRNIYNVAREMPVFFVSITNPQVKTTVRSYGFTMRVEKPLTHYLSLKTGLQFLQTRQNVTFNAESVNQYAVVNTLGIGADTARFTQISLHRPLLKSMYNSFTLPVLISYQASGKKVSIGASGGIMVNLFSWYEGEVPDGNYKNSIDAKQAFRSYTGSSLYASLHVAKSFGNWQLFAEPQLQYSLSSITKKKISFQQRMTYYGLGIGVKKSIGK